MEGCRNLALRLITVFTYTTFLRMPKRKVNQEGGAGNVKEQEIMKKVNQWV